MAKKILSILCALAMMVTMVSVAAFSASAAETTTVNLLDSTNINKWAVTRENDNSWSMYSGAIDLTSQNLTGITGTLVLTNPNSGTYNYVDFDYEDALELGDDFVIDTTVFIKTNITADTTPNKDSYVALNLGDYSVRLVRFVDDAASESAWDRSNFRVALYKNDTLVKKSEIITGTTALYNGDPYANGFNGSNGDAPAEYIRTNAKNGADGAASGKVSFGKNSGWKDLTITVKDGTLSVADTTGVVLTETVEAGAFDNVTPSVRLFNDNNVMKLQPTAVFALNVTTNGTSTGGEGGETPDPEEPSGDVDFNLLDSKNITGWTLTRSCPNNWSNYNFSGNIDLTSLKLNGITGTLVQTQANSNTYTDVTFDYNNGVDPIDFGDNFSILMTAYINAEPSNMDTPDKDAYVSLKLGDYSVRLVHFVEDAVNDPAWNQRDRFRIAVYSGNTLIAVSDVIDRSVTTSLYDGAVISSNTDAWKNTGTYGGHIKSKSLAANLQPAGTGVSFKGDNSWKDVEIVVNDNKMTIKTVAGVCGLHVLSGSDSADDVTTLSGFTTTALDIPNGTSFDGIAPQVVLSVDGTLRKGAAIGVFRLEGTIYAPEDSGETVASPEAPKGFLSINDSLALNFTLGKTDAGYSNIAATATIGGSPVDVKLVTKTLADGEHNVAVIDSLTPDQFGTEVVLNVTATKGGQQVTGTMTYSVKQYCENMMGKDTDLDNLCAYILKYGEAVRVMNGGAGDSITAGVDFSGIDTSLEWTAEGKTNNYGISSANGTVSWNSGNLNLADNIGINFTFTLPAGADIDDYNLFVDVVDAEFGVVGGDIESITPLGNNKYRAVARVYAYDMDKDVTAVVKDTNNNAVSAVFTSGVENYILEAIENDKFDDNELAVAEAMMTFGNAAAAYKAAN